MCPLWPSQVCHADWRVSHTPQGSITHTITSTQAQTVRHHTCGATLLQNGPKKGVVGMDMMGAICDFCEAWVCHNRVCIAQHGCECLLRQSEDPGSYAVQCTECDRDVWMQGGRFFKCSTCAKWLCSDDQMEHQASCQCVPRTQSLTHTTRTHCNSTNKVCLSWCRYIDGDTYHCISCSRLGNWTCLRCKICFCDNHVVGKINVAKKGEAMTCKRCRFELQETKGLSISGEPSHNVAP